MKNKLIERFTNYLFGYARVKIKGYPSRALTAMFKSGIEYWDLREEPDGIVFCLPVSRKTTLTKILAGTGCTVEVTSTDSAAHTLSRYRRRPGILVGVIIFMLVLGSSTLFVWDISVEGNSTLTDWEIIDSFTPYGVKYGAYIPSIDPDGVCHSYLIDSEDIAWVSVNITGTRANIVVKERNDLSGGWQDDAPSNIIAAESGQIVSFTAWSGEAKIHLGDVVAQGEVLISGVSEITENGETVGTRTDRSYGHVWAQVYREYTESVPLVSTQKIYTGRKFTEKEYKFFTKELKSFGKGGNDKGFYDKIISNERLTLFGFLKLPIFVSTSVCREYTEQECTFTEEQAADMASARMMQRLSEELTGCELISRKSEGVLADGVYTLKTSVYCIADIAKEVEITDGTENSAY